MAVISFQSRVALGHVGNSAAQFALLRRGHDVVALDTVSFSNHPGHGSFAGRAAEPADLAAALDSIERAGALEGCEAVLGGYLGRAANGPVLLDAVRRVRRHRTDSLFLLDPVLGDRAEGLYVEPEIEKFLAGDALAVADVVTPNLFELGRLTGRAIATFDSLDTVADAAAAVALRGPKVVVVTSVDHDLVRIGGQDAVSNLVWTAGRAWSVTTPRLDRKAKGAGDLLAALFLSWHLSGAAPPAALARAAAGVFGVLSATPPGALDMALASGQDELIAPTRTFDAVKVR